jgi:hypothetical protein
MSKRGLGANSLKILKFVAQNDGATNGDIATFMGWIRTKATHVTGSLRNGGYLTCPRGRQRPPFQRQAVNIRLRITNKGEAALKAAPKPRSKSINVKRPPIVWSNASGSVTVSDPQLRLLRLVARLSHRLGMAPTIKELKIGLGVASTNGVCELLVRLRSRGLIVWEEWLSRTTRITALGWEVLEANPEPPWVFIHIMQCQMCGAARAGAGVCSMCPMGITEAVNA